MEHIIVNKMIQHILDNGLMMKELGMANWNSLIKQCMKDNFIKERNLEKEK